MDQRDLAFNIVIMVVSRCLFCEKATFQKICRQNCENTAAKKPETRTKVDPLSEKANILSKKPARKIG